MFRATFENKTVGILLWYQHDDLAYYHLGAYNERGYEMKASFGLFWLSLEYFQNTTIRWLNLGAGAGLNAGAANGLTRFKQGWSTDTRTAYFCGRVFDMPAYERLVNQAPNTRSAYFPAYRAGEFW
jgi:lipid II:glycine glycyltransferase (peptidoglycan interpeptide bridge formation enzyme)